MTRQAEAQALNEGEWAIFDLHDYDLKAVVNFHDRTIWVMTRRPDLADAIANAYGVLFGLFLGLCSRFAILQFASTLKKPK